jgi:predicted nucleotidyltransferase
MITKFEIDNLRNQVNLMKPDFRFMTIATDQLERLLNQEQVVTEAFGYAMEILGPDVTGVGLDDSAVDLINEAVSATKDR